MYFDKLVQEKGKDHVLTEFEKIVQNLDFNTKLGRDLLNYTKELTQKIIYYERSIEDHANISLNICEADLYKVYQAHLKKLEDKYTQGNTLIGESNVDSRLVYQSNSANKNRLMSLSLTAVPFFFSGMFGGYIDILFGSYMKYASFFLLQGLLHSGHGNLFAKKSILTYPFSKLVLNLRLLNKHSLQIQYYEFFRTHTATVPLSEFNFNYKGKTIGNKELYTLNDFHGKTVYHILIDDDSKVDSKLFEFIASSKSPLTKYDITDVLINRSKFINNEAEVNVSSNIDNMIRVKIASERNVDVSNTEEIEFVKKVNLIDDSLVKEFYTNLQKAIGEKKQNLETTLAEIKSLFTSLLNNEIEAARIAEVLHKEYSVTEFKDLKRISKDKYNSLLRSNTSLVEQDIEKVIKSILASFA